MHRVTQLRYKAGHDQLVSLWVLRNHPFLLDDQKWSVFMEDYFKWYKKIPLSARTALIKEINRDICKNWHLIKVRGNSHVNDVYWSETLHQQPAYYFTRQDFSEPWVDDNNHKIYPYTSEDGYLAVLHRVLFVHGPEILQV
jgi:hypothetical protein